MYFYETPDYFIVTYSNTIFVCVCVCVSEAVVNTSERSAPTKQTSYSKVGLRKQSRII